MNHHVFNMAAELAFYRNDELFIGSSQVRIMKQVMIDGSIHLASKNLKVSYQYAWHILDKLNKLSPVPVVLRQKGGRDGGGCTISPYGKNLIRVYENKLNEITDLLAQDNSDLDGCFL